MFFLKSVSNMISFGILMFFLTFTDAKVKTWIPNTSFNNSANWNHNRLPCMTNNVVFPKSLNLPIELPDNKLEIRSIVLSDFGYLVFPRNGGVYLTDKTIHASCEGGDIEFTRKEIKLWVDPDSWSEDGNEATPHTERIPCSTDDVIFPDGNTFYVRLPESSTRVSSITISGKRMTGQSWLDFLTSDMGRETFETSHANLRAVNSPCESQDGCECDNSNEEEICAVVLAKKYPLAFCDTPVSPIGFCFPICGAQIRYNKGDFLKIQQELEIFSKEENIIGHVSRINGFIQIVMLEKGEYTGIIKEKAESFNQIISRFVENKPKLVQLTASGLSIRRESSSTYLKQFFEYFLVAAVTMGVIIVYYHNTWKIDTSILTNLESRLGTFTFARFENQSGIVEVGCERVQRCPPPVLENEVTAFDNPMFTEVNQDNEETMKMTTLKKLDEVQLDDMDLVQL